MSKLAERLRAKSLGNGYGSGFPDYAEAADALDACERALRDILDHYVDLSGTDGPQDDAVKDRAREALAKLEAAR